MKEEHEQHLKEIKTEIIKLIDHKYRKGQAEHGGELWAYGPEELIKFLIEEVTDLVVYSLTLQQVLKQLLAVLNETDYNQLQSHFPQEPQEPTPV